MCSVVVSVVFHVCRQGEPVCSVLGKTYGNECLLYKEACRKRRRTNVAHRGPCLGTNMMPPSGDCCMRT
uniref:Kazal-like domain-containing protein n=1 Tax=Scleropages formosus TaxID=113540 RepID=A0A8C9W692_SCLFO